MHKIAFLFALFAIAITSQASAAERRCNAAIVWETTGGSVKGTLDTFTGVGKCGRTVPNRCRKRARAAIERCAKTHYDRRWTHYPTDNRGSPTPSYDRNPPEACTRGAGIEGYTMRKRCEKHPTDGRRICNNSAAGQNVRQGRAFVEVSKPGNIKHALEASVCCFKDHGLKRYQNPNKVHVRLKALASSSNNNNRHCKLNTLLEDNYVINCTNVRANLCSR